LIFNPSEQNQEQEEEDDRNYNAPIFWTTTDLKSLPVLVCLARIGTSVRQKS